MSLPDRIVDMANTIQQQEFNSTACRQCQARPCQQLMLSLSNRSQAVSSAELGKPDCIFVCQSLAEIRFLLSGMSAEEMRQNLVRALTSQSLSCLIPTYFDDAEWDSVGDQIRIWENLVEAGQIKVVRLPFDTDKVKRFKKWFKENNRFIRGSGRPAEEESSLEITPIPSATGAREVSPPSDSPTPPEAKVDTSAKAVEPLSAQPVSQELQPINQEETSPDVVPSSPTSTHISEKVTCELLAVSVQCSHKRKASANGLLEVVPAELGDKIVLVGKMNGGCGKHPEWRISGFWTSTKTGSTTSFKANAWRIGKPGWLSYVFPHTYQIAAKGCEGGSRSVQIKAYPSDKLSVKVNAKTWRTAKDKLDYAINTVLGAWLKETKFEFLKGSGSITAGWEEYPLDHRAYYKYDASIGFNPLVGGKIRIPFGPTAAIPEWVKKYGDIYLFVEFSGGVEVNGHWGKKTPDERTVWAEAKGYINGKIGASLFLMNPEVLKAEVSGGTGIGLNAWGDDQAEKPTLLAQFRWEGLTGAITIEVAWGLAEFNREFRFVDGKSFPDKPFSIPLPV